MHLQLQNKHNQHSWRVRTATPPQPGRAPSPWPLSVQLRRLSLLQPPPPPPLPPPLAVALAGRESSSDPFARQQEDRRSPTAEHSAHELVLAAHLKRLLDRQRHAIARLPGEVQLIERFKFDGRRLPSLYRPEECWWFCKNSAAGGSSVEMRCGLAGRGPPVGTRRWCYRFTSTSLAQLFQVDWHDITADALLDIFEAWSHDSALKVTGLDGCIRECAPRQKAREQLDPITLHVWNLLQLAQQHVGRYCEPSVAWQLSYAENGRARVPPLRMSPRDIFPVTEHESQILLRRPHLAALLHHAFLQALASEADTVGEEEVTAAIDRPVAPERSFGDDRSVLSNVTPDYDSEEKVEEEEEKEMDTSS